MDEVLSKPGTLNETELARNGTGLFRPQKSIGPGWTEFPFELSLYSAMPLCPIIGGVVALLLMGSKILVFEARHPVIPGDSQCIFCADEGTIPAVPY